MKRRSLAVVVSLVCGIALLGPPPAMAGVRSRTTRLAPGVRYTRITDTRGPWRINVLSIALGARSTIDTALAGNALRGLERTSSMARRHRAIAAINGDFAQPSGRPVHTFAGDGQLFQTPLAWGRNFAVDTRERRVYIGHPEVTMWVADASGRRAVTIDRLNDGPARAGTAAAFTPAGAGVARPPRRSCSARLRPSETFQLTGPSGTARAPAEVEGVRCSDHAAGVKGGYLIVTPRWARGRAGSAVRAMRPGDRMSLNWSLGWPGTLDTIGGNPTIVADGEVLWSNVTGDHPFLGPHPRTGVGRTAAGRVLFVTVDGRRPGWSVGMTLRRFARLMVSLGATEALNLDGGGSTTMIVDGRVVNRPSDGRERPVSSALLLLPGRDPGERASSEAATRSSSSVSSATVWDLVAADAASTGGLASAMRAGGRGLPSSLHDVARIFEDR